MNIDMKRLCYEKPEAGLIQLNSPLNLLVFFSAVDAEVDQFDEGEGNYLSGASHRMEWGRD